MKKQVDDQFEPDVASRRRMPGMDTVIRLAVRIEAGRSVEEAAAREYIYRWRLTLRPDPDLSPSFFGAPHLLGA